MNVNEITLTPAQIAGNAEGIGNLRYERLGYDYVNDKRADTPTFMYEEVVFLDNDFEKVTVKVPGTKPLVPAEQLKQQKGKIKVKFKNLRGRFYRTNSGEYALSCSADGVEVIA